MKILKPLLALTAILCFHLALAQSDAVEFRTDMTLNKFIGTWQYQSSDTVFTIEIMKVIVNSQKHNPKAPTSIDSEQLIGWHELVVSGSVVESNMNSKDKSYKYDKTDHMIFWNTMPNNDKEIRFSNFKNISKKKSAKGVFIIQPDDNNKSQFILYESILKHENMTVGVEKVKSLSDPNKEKTVLYVKNPGEKIENGFTVPNRIIITRIK